MAATMEQEMEALREAIMPGKDEITDDAALIQSITEEQDLDDGIKKRKALDSICINGVRVTDMLEEDELDDISSYARAVREALSAENDSFVTIANENYSKHRAVIPASTINYNDPEAWALSEEAAAETDKAVHYAVNYEDALNNAIKVNMTDNDADLLKSVTRIEEFSGKNMRKALDSIYINGKNLTDTLGELNENNLSMYAREVRKALSPDNNSFITIMKRNSAFAAPKAVISADTFDDPKAQEMSDRKKNAALGYVASYRDDVHKNAKAMKELIEKTKKRDARLFFSRLFKEGENPDELDDSTFTDQAILYHFDNILPDFVRARAPENIVYAYMLTKNFPDDNSDRKLTYEEILMDNSQEMIDFKKRIGKEFCELFQMPTENAAEKFNSKVYPALMNMVDAILHIRNEYSDISQKDGAAKALLTVSKLSFVHDLSQQTEFCDIAAIGRTQCFSTLNILNNHRLNYMASDEYLNGGILPNGRIKPSYGSAICTEGFFDNVDNGDLKKVCNSVIGTIDMRRNSVLANTTSQVEVFCGVNQNNTGACIAYINGQGGPIQEYFENSEFAKVMRETAIAAENGREKENGDLILDSISVGTGRSNPDKYLIQLSDLRKYFFGNDAYVHATDGLDYDATKKSILNSLTGCPVITSREPDAREKAMLMAAVNTVYINDKSMAEYFKLTEDNILTKLEDVEKKLAGIILNSMENGGPDFVLVKNGKDSFHEINIEFINEINRYEEIKPEEFYGPEDIATVKSRRYKDFEYVDKMNDERKKIFEKNTAIGKAYADMLSGRADKAAIEEYKDIFAANNMKTPAANISVNSLIGVLSQDKTGDVLSGFTTGRKLNTPQELEDAAKNIYIGNKTLARLCPKRENMSDEAVTRQREQLLRDNFNKLLENSSAEPQLMSIRDKNGVLKPLKIINLAKEPEPPTPVKLYSKFETHFHFDSTVAANIKAYEKYINDNEDYKRDKALYDKLTKYNNSAESTRLKIINEEKLGQTQRALSIDQAQLTRNGGLSGLQNNGPALTQPDTHRQAQQNGPTVG